MDLGVKSTPLQSKYITASSPPGARFLQPNIRLRYNYYVQLVAIKRDWMRVLNLKSRIRVALQKSAHFPVGLSIPPASSMISAWCLDKLHKGSGREAPCDKVDMLTLGRFPWKLSLSTYYIVGGVWQHNFIFFVPEVPSHRNLHLSLRPFRILIKQSQCIPTLLCLSTS